MVTFNSSFSFPSALPLLMSGLRMRKGKLFTFGKPHHSQGLDESLFYSKVGSDYWRFNGDCRNGRSGSV
jgi:hypothetical protein